MNGLHLSNSLEFQNLSNSMELQQQAGSAPLASADFCVSQEDL